MTTWCAGTSPPSGLVSVADRHYRIPHHRGKLYLCAIKDVSLKRIVGYSIDARLNSELAGNALRNAIALRGPVGAVMH